MFYDNPQKIQEALREVIERWDQPGHLAMNVVKGFCIFMDWVYANNVAIDFLYKGESE